MIVKLLAKVTSSFTKPFVSDELGESFANSLNFCLQKLASKNQLNLKVNNADQYGFDPRHLLRSVILMYANMSVEEQFQKNVANDTRSFDIETFRRAY
mmetsp:Transcript_35257/g.26295  ORF Transcript_35257/g.26295 Transcript_35257/m.26295 type:complete len:98 (-) Transcript_35257:516-809(-)